MVNSKLLKVGITHGDINGIGYEVILKTFQDEEMLDICTPVVYGSPRAATYHKKALENGVNFTLKPSAAQAEHGVLNMVNCFGDEELAIDLGNASSDSGKAAFVALEKAVEELQAGYIDVLVTAPINKHNIQSAGFTFPGHTEYLAAKAGEGKEPLMILFSDRLRVALVTTHLPIAQVAKSITKELVAEKIKALNASLYRDFNISNPRIAVLALNPHCGDEGTIGAEDDTIVRPAVEECFAEGVMCAGPYAADGFFGTGAYKLFDAVLAMYHDQGLAPFKVIANGEGVNYTAGLPFVRTSPAHGTGYDIVGKNIADPQSMRSAIYAAIDIWRNRSRQAHAEAHPLERHYVEKRDEGEKA